MSEVRDQLQALTQKASAAAWFRGLFQCVHVRVTDTGEAFTILLRGDRGEVRELALGEVVFHGVEEALAAAQALHGLGLVLAEAGGGLDVGGRLAGVLDRERRVHHAEEAGTDALSGAADADEAGQGKVLGGQLQTTPTS